ncbi:uncharacterized protein LOC111240571 [Vigna radiata var. radiata]|uniref:Uncharacterized protein LOC111240571 n=1 Tax=Vigna radiata var. radiata TaxID=3916 RepID=A0A3Q0EK85_VIGRR|nr:uncharacterized protein LOC111240571 [Vigna radiata var. radiata]XP_022631511.1 uncharacterized protein LOC111240571 [Vigna radiata var. radiata]
MEKHQAFLKMMARKKSLSKGDEGGSSAIKVTSGLGGTPIHVVHPALKLTDTTVPPADTKTKDVDTSKNKTKRKSAQEKTPSPTKRRKVGSSVLTNVLDPTIHVSNRMQFNLNAEEKKPFKGMSPSESLNMAYALIARASVCLNYTASTTRPLLVVELENAQKELEEMKKKNTTLTTRVEELTKTAEDDRVSADNKLKEAPNKISSLQQSVDDLQLDLLKMTSQRDKVTKERDAMEVERDKLVTENASLGDEICSERQLGFDQGIAQCHYFFQTPLTHPDFDIMKIYVDRKLVDLST